MPTNRIIVARAKRAWAAMPTWAKAADIVVAVGLFGATIAWLLRP